MTDETKRQLAIDPLFRRFVDSLVYQLLDEFGLTGAEMMRGVEAAVDLAAWREIERGRVNKVGDFAARTAEFERRVERARNEFVSVLPTGRKQGPES